MLFAAIVGLGAFLLFQVQLLLGKQLLPWFGGTSAVWTTCLLFFQTALLAGYAWAHILTDRLSPRRQRDAQIALVGAAAGLLLWRAFAWPSPLTPGPWARPGAADAPVLSILLVLASTIGLPFVALAATSPLLQAWFARLRPGTSPFWLFALSNAGSLAGLVSYPLVVEPLLPVRAQGRLWAAAFGLYAVGLAWCAVAAGRAPVSTAPVGPRTEERGEEPAKESAGRGGRLVWLALALFPSVMLAAVTSHLTQEVAAVPFLWMLPLALYLLSFVLSFAWPDAFRPAWRVALAVAAGLAVAGLHGALLMKAPARVGLWSAVLFVYGMAGHGELARLRPAAGRLTAYYLTIAAGGALGGVLTAVVAPVAFSGYWELHLGVLAGPLAVLAAVAGRDDGEGRQLRLLAGLGTAALAVALAADAVGERAGVERVSRSFYGVLRVERVSAGDPDEHVKLTHGRITHGLQLAAPGRRAETTTYYGPASGVGLALVRHPKRVAGLPLRIGGIGLGVGTLAAWGRPGDAVRFYELDPEVARLSEGERPVFTFVRDARGRASVTLGDGRLSLEREEPQAFDVLAVDAFSSDAVPVHLLTREAFEAYRRHLAPGGVLAVHVTNRYLDMKPVVRGAAAALSLHVAHVPSVERTTRWSSDWMLVAADRGLLDDEAVSAATLPPMAGGAVLWTDDWSHLLGVVKR
jgi:spermidine synthase